MVKKSIIALALISMLTSISYGLEVGVPDPNSGDSSSSSKAIKVDGQWPAEITIVYEEIPLCCIDVYIKVGMFIEFECGKDIVMEQVTCTGTKKFPCYKKCETFHATSNFNAIIKIKDGKIQPSDGIISKNNTKAYFFVEGAEKNSVQLAAGSAGDDFTICAEAWDVNLFEGTPGEKTQVGQICLTAMPDGEPNWCDYLDELDCD